MLFKLGICNWFPTAHNSRILKEMDLFLYAIVFGKKFNLRQFIFYRITEGLNITAIVNHLGNSVLITHYLLQHKISPEKDEMVSGIKKKLRISPNSSPLERQLIYQSGGSHHLLLYQLKVISLVSTLIMIMSNHWLNNWRTWRGEVVCCLQNWASSLNRRRVSSLDLQFSGRRKGRIFNH